MLNRTQTPQFHQVENVEILQPQTLVLDNGIPAYIVNAGDQDLVRMEFIFHNKWNTGFPLQAAAANKLLVTGTNKLSAKEISDAVDYYGAFLQTDYSSDFSSLVLFTLTRHLKAVLPVLYEVLNHASYPVEELELYKRNQQQSLEVKLERNDYVARQTFSKQLFGQTAYANRIDENLIVQLDQTQVLEFDKTVFTPQNCTIIVAGKFKQTDFAVLNEIMGKPWQKKGVLQNNVFALATAQSDEIYVHKADAMQSALFLGNLSINRKHEDFAALQFTNCVLGGYFGSRLMANIREDKGYTYGIHSGLASPLHTGYWFIATEVGVSHAQATLNEIEKEICILQSVAIGDDELDLVKNYMLGSMLGSLENAFSHADKFKSIYFWGLDYRYFDNYIQTIKEMDAATVKNMAQKYFSWDNLVKVIVGKK